MTLLLGREIQTHNSLQHKVNLTLLTKKKQVNSHLDGPRELDFTQGKTFLYWHLCFHRCR